MKNEELRMEKPGTADRLVGSSSIAGSPGTADRLVGSNNTPETADQTVGAPSQIWHREYWDRFIRDEQHYQSTLAYIRSNPVKAKPATQSSDWPYVSAPEFLQTQGAPRMKKHPAYSPKKSFQPLEIFSSVFPIIGNFFSRFSNRWKLFQPFFQSLETFHFTLLLLLSSFILYPLSFSLAAPQPSFHYYGQITTERGLPFTPGDEASLLIRSGDRVISRSTLERTGVAGCNYLAEIPLDSDASPYRDYALKSGATVTFALVDANNRENALYPVGTIPAVGRPGDAKR
ncbi:MAG: hypothetical protein PHG65_11975, partial [Kiritimatiellae bacterium]|nr:hypothetical protein [Kiritimatiellia bacterium]